MSGDLKAPEAVQEGEVIVVQYHGPGTLYYSVDGGDRVEIPVDEDGYGRITAPIGAFVILISDFEPTPAEAAVEVHSAARRR